MAILDTFKDLLVRGDSFVASAKTFKHQHRKAIQDNENAAIAEKAFICDRARHLFWNNVLIQNGVEAFVSNVGTLDVVFVDEKGTEIPFWREAWKVFTDNISYDGYGNFSTIQAIAARSLAVEGEYFARRVATGDNPFVPFQLESIPARNIPESYLNVIDKVFYGISFKKGKPFSYLVKPYEKDYEALLEASQTYPYGYNVVPADKMIHVWQKHFSDQKRGLPILTSVALTAWNHSDLEQSVITQAINSASFAYSVKKTSPLSNTRQDPAMNVGKGKTLDKDNVEKPINFYESEAGQFLHGDAEIELLQSQGIETGINDMLSSMQKVIAGALYSASFQIDGDCTQFNYSSMRAALVAIDTKLTLLRKSILEPELLYKVVNWWMEIMLYEFPNEVKPKIVTRYPKNVVPNLLELMRAYEIAAKNHFMPVSQIYDELDINPEEFDSARQKLWDALQAAAATKPAPAM